MGMASLAPPYPRSAARPALNVRPFFEDKGRAFWTLQAIGWGGYLIVREAASISGGPTIDIVVPVLVEAILGYCITLLLSALYGRYRQLPRVAGVALTVATLVAATLIYAFLVAYAFSLISLRVVTPGVGVKAFLQAFYICFTVLAGWSSLYFGINFYILVEEQIDQMRDLEVQASSAQLAMLRYQLNPHFLFNTLNSISTLVLLKQTDRANAMLSRLSSFLRYTLANEPTAHVTVAQEVETLKLYLEIEKMRFEARLRPKFDIDAAAERARLPSLLLQPLVENAIKYAVTPQEEGADICVQVRLIADRVHITVSDTGPGVRETTQLPSLSTGVGLANIRERLVQAYGPDQSFVASTTPDGGFAVAITLPFQVEELKEAA